MEDSSSQTFRELLNGFFQAEGTISASFLGPDSIKINPYFLMNQNYSAESLAFFVKIFYELGQVGKVSVYLNDYNLPSKWKIRFYKSFRFIKIFMYRIIKDNSVHKNRSSTSRTWKLINKLPGTAVHPPILKNGG